jgi:hypothetical protein
MFQGETVILWNIVGGCFRVKLCFVEPRYCLQEKSCTRKY